MRPTDSCDPERRSDITLLIPVFGQLNDGLNPECQTTPSEPSGAGKLWPLVGSIEDRDIIDFCSKLAR